MVLQSSKYLIGSEPTNWIEKLAPYYTEQNKQEEKSLAEFEANRAEQVKVASEESFVKTLGYISEFSSKAANIYQAHKKAAAQEELKERSLFESEMLLDPNQKWKIEGAKLKYAADKGDVTAQKDLDALIAKLKKDGNHEAAEAIENESPRNIVWRNEFWARQQLPNLTEDAMQKDLAASGRLTEYEEAGDKTSFHKRWQLEKLGYLNLSKEFIAANLHPELQRQQSTGRGRQKAAAYTNVATKTQIQVGETIQQFKNDPEGLANYLQELREKLKTDFPGDIKDHTDKTITQQQQITNSIKKDIIAAALDSHIGTSTLQGYLNHLVKHDGFKGGETTIAKGFFTEDDVNEMVAAARIGEGRANAVRISTGTAELHAIRNAKGRGDTEYNGVPIDLAIQQVENRVPELKEQVNNALNIDVDANSAAGFERAKTKLDQDKANGFVGVTKETIKTIKNDQIRAEYERILGIIDKHNAQFGDHKGSLSETIVKAAGSVMPATGLGTGIYSDISNELDRRTAGMRLKLILSGVDPETIAGVVNEYKTGLWVSGGGGTKGQDGRYSADETGGDYTNYRLAVAESRAVKGQHSLNWTVERGELWAQSIQTKLVTGNYISSDGTINYEQAVKDGTFLNDTDIIGTLSTGNYSDRMFFIAKALNTDVNTLFEAGLKNFQKDTDKARRWGALQLENKRSKSQLRNYQVITNNFNDLVDKLWDKPVKNNTAYQAKDLQNLIRSVGWYGLEPEQRQRALTTMQFAANQDTDVGNIEQQVESSNIEEGAVAQKTAASKKLQEALLLKQNRSRGIDQTKEQLSELQDKEPLLGWDPDLYELVWDEQNNEWTIITKQQ